MIDVIAFLIEHFRDVDACPNGQDLSSLLEEVGFDDEQIKEAVNIIDILNNESMISANHLLDSTGMRVYSSEESSILPMDVQGLLHFLEVNGALNPEQREFVLHALVSMPPEDVTIEHTKVLALLVLWAHKSELPVLIGDELMTALKGELIMQ